MRSLAAHGELTTPSISGSPRSTRCSTAHAPGLATAAFESRDFQVTVLSGAKRRMVAAWLLAALFGAGAWWMSGFAADHLPAPRPLEELSYYPSGRMLEPATLGHAETFADLAWLRAVQYYGEHRRSTCASPDVHVFDILTSLSPGFIPAYVFADSPWRRKAGTSIAPSR